MRSVNSRSGLGSGVWEGSGRWRVGIEKGVWGVVNEVGEWRVGIEK